MSVDATLIAPQTLAHGGGLDAASRRFPNAPQPWLDLSTGVNPHHYPLPALEPDVFARLPDAGAREAAENAARAAYGAPAHMSVIAGAGTQAFIQLLPRLVNARRVATLGFTYAEHAAAWIAAGAQVERVEDPDALADYDVAIIVNPNNPDGRMIGAVQLAALAETLHARGGLLIVDEAFVEASDDGVCFAPLAPQDGAIILRSFGKAYGLPGVRLGFAVAPRRYEAALRALLGPWSVGGPALAIGAAALADARWLAESRARAARDAAQLDAVLTQAGLEIVGGAFLFRLAACDDAAALHDALAAQGILTRRFAERPRWLRFGLPPTPQAFARLACALERRHGR
jgi:cobalamin biosynthesis protein CobC